MFDIWMITSVLSTQDHSNERERHPETADGLAKNDIYISMNIPALEANVS